MGKAYWFIRRRTIIGFCLIHLNCRYGGRLFTVPKTLPDHWWTGSHIARGSVAVPAGPCRRLGRTTVLSYKDDNAFRTAPIELPQKGGGGECENPGSKHTCVNGNRSFQLITGWVGVESLIQ